MTYDDARSPATIKPALRVGQSIAYPPDRGSPGGHATVTRIGEIVSRNIHGTPFVWVNLKGAGVWPSNRLGYKIEVR